MTGVNGSGNGRHSLNESSRKGRIVAAYPWTSLESPQSSCRYGPRSRSKLFGSRIFSMTASGVGIVKLIDCRLFLAFLHDDVDPKIRTRSFFTYAA